MGQEQKPRGLGARRGHGPFTDGETEAGGGEWGERARTKGYRARVQWGWGSGRDSDGKLWRKAHPRLWLYSLAAQNGFYIFKGLKIKVRCENPMKFKFQHP